MLASIRRSLVSHVEQLHGKRTALKRALKEYSRNVPSGGRAAGDYAAPAQQQRPPQRQEDVVASLEAALLSLGRCVDLVRPAGLLVSSVSKGDWNRALVSLERSMKEIRRTCDPDRPLRPTEWGKLVDDEAATLDVGADVRKRPRLYGDLRRVIDNMSERNGGEAPANGLDGLDLQDAHGDEDSALWMFGDE